MLLRAVVDGRGEGAGEHRNERTPACVSERAQATTKRSAVMAVPIVIAAPSDVRMSRRREIPFTCSCRMAFSVSLVSAWGLSAGSTW